MTFARKPDIEAAPMQEQTVLFHPGKKSFCVLNETAAFLWETLAEAATEDELLAALKRAFDVPDADSARRDLDDALAQLVELDLITSVA